VRRRASLARAFAAVGALVVWAALALQFYLLLGKLGGLAVWRFVGYFTILTNILVAVMLTSAALRRSRGAARFELAVATAIAIVGIVYSLLLRQIWDPQGADKLADAMLHDAAPLVCVAWFLLRPRRRLGVADVAAALIFPLLYVLYALARGAADGWYAYWFLDPHRLGVAQMALNIAGLTLAFLAVAAVLAYVSNRLNAGDGALSQSSEFR
jgi:hypothetical protein